MRSSEDDVAEDLKLTARDHMPGGRLRVAREAAGMTLDEVARVTRIGKSYLEALEADEYDRLPNPAYVKGVIRSYAEAVGLAPEPLVQQYREEGEIDEFEEEQPVTTPPRRKSWLLMIILTVAVCGGYLLAQWENAPPPEVSRPTEQPPPVQPSHSGVLPHRSSAMPPATVPMISPQPEPAKETPSAVPSPPAGVVLKVTAVEECHLSVTIDDAPAQQYDLKPGDEIEWMGERYFALEMSDAGAIEAELKGKSLPSLGKSGVATTVVISADGQIE